MPYTSILTNYKTKHGFEAFLPKAVLFDMDGVLYNSMPNHAIAWRTSMAKFGIDMTAEDAYATEGARGVDTIRNMVKAQQGRDIDEAEAQRMYDEKTRVFHTLPETPIMPGVIELMSQINACGLTIAVVTGSGQRPLINRLLTDFSDYLNEANITTAYDVARGKPNPDPYLAGMRKAGSLQPWQTIVVENAPLGIHAGVAAQAFTVAVNTGPLPDEALLSEHPDLLFSRMTDFSNEWATFYNTIKQQ
jgi:HAD superfamily hydrolase (TIGR01509 family)